MNTKAIHVSLPSILPLWEYFIDCLQAVLALAAYEAWVFFRLSGLFLVCVCVCVCVRLLKVTGRKEKKKPPKEVIGEFTTHRFCRPVFP